MRTVAALQCEELKAVEYESHLEEAKQAGETRAKKIGFANGLLFSTGNLQTGLTLRQLFSRSLLALSHDSLPLLSVFVCIY